MNVHGGLIKPALKINILMQKLAHVCVKSLAPTAHILKNGIQKVVLVNVQRYSHAKLIDIGMIGHVSANASKHQEIAVQR